MDIELCDPLIRASVCSIDLSRCWRHGHGLRCEKCGLDVTWKIDFRHISLAAAGFAKIDGCRFFNWSECNFSTKSSSILHRLDAISPVTVGRFSPVLNLQERRRLFHEQFPVLFLPSFVRPSSVPYAHCPCKVKSGHRVP